MKPVITYTDDHQNQRAIEAIEPDRTTASDTEIANFIDLLIKIAERL